MTSSVGYPEGERGFAATVAQHFGTQHANCVLAPEDMMAAVPAHPADEPLDRLLAVRHTLMTFVTTYANVISSNSGIACEEPDAELPSLLP